MLKSGEKCGVSVVGGGPSGLVAAVLLAQRRLPVRIFAPLTPEDTRTTALLRDSVTLLESMGLWSRLRPYATPLKAIHLIDDTGRLPRAPSLSFNSSTFGDEPFGFNIANKVFTRELEVYAKTLPSLTLYREQAKNITPGEDGVSISLSGSSNKHSTALVVGADGTGSPCRTAAGIPFSVTSYNQEALVFDVQHTLPHQDSSIEFHTATGPFTLVPLAGDTKSSVVWVVSPSDAKKLLHLPDELFIKQIESRSHGALGDIVSIGKRVSFPLVRALALRMAQRRIALVGDSGHTLPPIGAQGLNLGLRDAAMLTEIIEDTIEQRADIGAQSTLSIYDERRRADITTRINAIDAFNHSVISRSPATQIARGLAISTVKHSSFLRELLVRIALGPIEDVPRAMKRGRRW